MVRWLAVAAFLAACNPSERRFYDLYTDRWCDVFADQCDPDAFPPAFCREAGRTAYERPPSTTCDYDGARASDCLWDGRWSCEGTEVIPPGACAGVFTCDDG